jgi:hypothetical protein
MSDPDDYLPLELPDYVSSAAAWVACDAYHEIISAHPDDQPYIISQYLDAFAKRFGRAERE